MANTVANLPTVNKYDVSKTIIEPLFMGQEYMSYMDIMPNVSGTVVIDKFKQLGGITNAFSSSFSAETAEIGDTVTITPVRREAEIAFRGDSLYNKINRDDITQGSDAALASGKGLEILKGLYDAASPELLEAGNHAYFVSGDIADDYMAATLESSNFAAAGYGAMVDGVPQLTYRGIPLIVRRDWDVAIAANVANINGASNAAETHRAMLTTKDAFVVATDFNENSVEQWYSNDNKEYRFRVAYSIGCALKDAKLAVYYTPDNMA